MTSPTTPLIVFATDAKGALTLTAGPGLSALGVGIGESLGKTVYDLAPDNKALVEAVESALRGEHVTVRVDVNGRTLEATLAPHLDESGIVTGLVGAGYDVASDSERTPISERVYTIQSRPDAFGMILEAHDSSGARPDLVGQACFNVFGGSADRCKYCPANGLGFTGPVTRVLQRSPGGEYRVVTAERKTEDTIQIRSRGVSEMLLSDLIQARIEQIGRNARLSAREREVFELMLLGRSPADIAQVLGIKERTAKFHQANLLKKLGADSRYDLQRLVLHADALPEEKAG